MTPPWAILPDPPSDSDPTFGLQDIQPHLLHLARSSPGGRRIAGPGVQLQPELLQLGHQLPAEAEKSSTLSTL